MCSEKTYNAPSGKRRAQELDSRGVYVEPLSENHDGTLSLSELRRRLRSHGGADVHLATHALVEPGPRLARSFIDAGLADRVWVFESPRPIDEPTAPAAVPLPEHYVVTGTLRVGDDTLTEYMNSRSELFFVAEPSADFVLAQDAIATSSRP
jgi:riboflavin biosynthesis pyrimidine reductase